MAVQKCISFAILVFSLVQILNGLDSDQPTNTVLGGWECKLTVSMDSVFRTVWPHSGDVDPNDNIKLELHTRLSNKTIIAENGRVVKISDSDFRPNRKTVLIAHGFREDSSTEWITPLIDAYLKYKDVNVIVVNWGVFTLTVDYYASTEGVAKCAQQVVDSLEDIVYQFGNTTSLAPMHLIGFSLGAQVMANVAKRFNKKQDIWKIERITGLDPADPCFGDNAVRLNASDAPFVDIIHTNGDQRFDVVFGTAMPIGHVDFYVNRGQIQPGCPENISWYDSVVDDKSGFFTAVCSHTKAPRYFIQSLELVNAGEPPLIGMKWKRNDLPSALDFLYNNTCRTNCLAMGILADNQNEDSSGVYFVPAASQKPYNVIQPSDMEKIEKILKESLG
ncbi:pancreatic triacylglycerol lipase [Diachasma alloeum]|uniref:pancreatic triacylglycerol lipase n=1 Tax=Diachasma alloeum TaxID=454923 RepID=UPI0007381802|nr:pancreatic triacylglycerol lipase [Diachasma alloeum]